MGKPSQTDEISAGDLFLVYKTGDGDYRTAPQGVVLDWFSAQFASPGMAVNDSTPATGFNIAVPTPTKKQWMLLRPAGTLASGTITLPLNTSTPDGTEVLVTSTQIITSFLISLNGASAAYGVPSSLTAGGFFTLRYNTATNCWYRVS